MVKAEPNITRAYLVMFFWLCYSLSGSLYVFSKPSPYENRYVTLFAPVFVGIVNIGSGIAQLRFWYKQNQWRQQAVTGESQFVAEQQLSPHDSNSLALPITIIQRTSKGWTIVLIASTIFFLVLVLYFLYNLLQETLAMYDIKTLFIFVLMLFAFPLFIAAPLLRGYQTLTADERGLHVRVGLGRVHTIRWDEAKLFALSSSYKAGYNNRLSVQQGPTYYELSNMNEVVRWRWIHSRGFVAIEPALPVEEYDRQMQAVLSLVTAKTGLTLYDVRPMIQIR